MAARHELDRVGDDLTADERGLHPLASHRDAVGDGDRVELHRVRARGFDASLQWRRQLAQSKVARHGLQPAVRDADERFVDVLSRQADRVNKPAGRGSVPTLTKIAARQIARRHDRKGYLKADSRSARRSATSSTPIESRMSPSPTPARLRSSAG